MIDKLFWLIISSSYTEEELRWLDSLSWEVGSWLERRERNGT